MVPKEVRVKAGLVEAGLCKSWLVYVGKRFCVKACVEASACKACVCV